MTKQEYRDIWYSLAEAAGFITGVIIMLVISAVMSGCKTVQTSEQVTSRDSTHIEVIHDTIFETVHDTVYVEVQQSVRTDEGTTIEFGEGGGSYNSKTGEANNVKSVKEQKQTEQDTKIKAEWSHREESYKATIDSLNTTISDLQKENEKLQQPKDCNHLRIFLWGLAAGVVAVYLVKFAWWFIKKYYLHR